MWQIVRAKKNLPSGYPPGRSRVLIFRKIFSQPGSGRTRPPAATRRGYRRPRGEPPPDDWSEALEPDLLKLRDGR
jgi:hypothetical protein